MKQNDYRFDWHYYAQGIECIKDDIRYENGYVLTYELSWKFESKHLASVDFASSTHFKKTNIVELLPVDLDFNLIRQMELVPIQQNRVVVNIYLTECPSFLLKKTKK